MTDSIAIMSHATVDYVVKTKKTKVTPEEKRELVKKAMEKRDFSWGSGAAMAIRLYYLLDGEVGPKVVDLCWNIPEVIAYHWNVADDFPGKELMRLFDRLHLSKEHTQIIPNSNSRQNLILVNPDGKKYFDRVDDGQELLDNPIKFPDLNKVKVIVNQCLSSITPTSFEEKMREFRKEAYKSDKKIITNYAINARRDSVAKIIGNKQRVGLLKDSVLSTHSLFVNFEELDMAYHGFNIGPDYQFKTKSLEDMIRQAIDQAKYLRESCGVKRVYIMMGSDGSILQNDRTIRIRALPLRKGEKLIGAGTGDAYQITSAAQPFYGTTDEENLVIQSAVGYVAAQEKFGTPGPNFRRKFLGTLDEYARLFYKDFEREHGIDHDKLMYKVKHPSSVARMN